MRLIHERTTGIDPRNVHASDGRHSRDAFSDAVTTLAKTSVRRRRHIASLIKSLDPEGRSQLAEEIARSFRSASEHPDPPHTAFGRFISNMRVKLDHTFEDVATPTHPGSDTVDG